jgi:lipid A disaccharide synthetase
VQIAIVTGEASGDRVGGQLAAELLRLRPDANLWGTGGQFLRQSGAEVVIDSSRYGVIGVAAAVRLLPRILRARKRLQREMLRRRPDVFVPVDAGSLNLGFWPIEGLCPWVRRSLPETRILYYFPPASWRKHLNGTSLNVMADVVATPFPWSESELRRLGVNAHFVGHPLIDLVKPSEPAAAFAERYGLHRDQPVVGILPGSRSQEIAEILPIQLEAAAIVHRRIPGVQFLIALAPTVDRSDVVRAVERLRRQGGAHLADLLHRVEERLLRGGADGVSGPRPARVRGIAVTPHGAVVPGVPPAEDPFVSRTREQLLRAEGGRAGRDIALAIVENATYDVMAASDVLMMASGTATLEGAILGKPMVILYRLAKSNWLEYQFVKKRLPEFIGMPNLIAGKRICPELIQDAATPEALASEVIAVLLEPERMLRAKEDLRAATRLLGESGGATRAAQMVIELAETGAVNAGERTLPSDGM